MQLCRSTDGTTASSDGAAGGAAGGSEGGAGDGGAAAAVTAAVAAAAETATATEAAARRRQQRANTIATASLANSSNSAGRGRAAPRALQANRTPRLRLIRRPRLRCRQLLLQSRLSFALAAELDREPLPLAEASPHLLLLLVQRAACRVHAALPRQRLGTATATARPPTMRWGPLNSHSSTNSGRRRRASSLRAVCQCTAGTR